MHWQNDLAAPSGKLAKDMPERLAAAHTIENTQAVLKASREKGMLVIYVNASHRPGYPEDTRLSCKSSILPKPEAW